VARPLLLDLFLWVGDRHGMPPPEPPLAVLEEWAAELMDDEGRGDSR